MDMLKHAPVYDEQSTKLADAAKSFPSWDRDARILKVQIIDSCTRREARRQVDKMAQSFVRHLEEPPRAPVYVRYHTGWSRLLPRLPRTNLFPMPANGRT